MAEVEMPLTGHLDELRTRLVRALIAVLVGFAVCYPQSSLLFDFLKEPLTSSIDAAGIHATIIGTGVAEAFFTRLKVSLIGAAFLALPVILYQLWMFVIPGLKQTEARYARGFVAFGSLFFIAGAAFCYRIVFPFAFPFFLAEYRSIGVDPAIRIGEYLSFTARLLLAFGITFELPVATFFLARAGLVTHHTLLTHARYAILVMFVVAAVLTPPDAISQLLMVGPLILLYAISIGVAYVFRRRSKTAEDEDGE